ncbi:hypothetical protein FNU76_20635 [Chitinimonas arctica]|uniref:Spore coat protein U domain-containing protein n=1 Tax=Chitinimonas arctica TaxID=2594795 RepID=A0A516SK92_9NEIS|nr:hypothetical protein [Chitinimonas arctica]QDQ28564.1 hypothetical protein FNU76_20635 [Chitinimonas arctica]
MKLQKLLVALGFAGLSALASATTLNGTCYYTATVDPTSISVSNGNTVSLQASFTTSRAMWNTSGCGTFGNVDVKIVERKTGRVLVNTQLNNTNDPNMTYGGRWITPRVNYTVSGFTPGNYEVVAYVGFNGWYHDTNPTVTSMRVN